MLHPCMVRPPDTLMVWPVMNLASSLRRNAIDARIVVRLAETAERDGARQRLLELLVGEGVEQRRVGRAGADDVER